jgi:GNAT superfamily N-acetyltransferase
VIIRDRTPGDAPALEAIAFETHRIDGYPKYLPTDLRSFIVEPEAIGAWVADLGGEVIGHVALHPRSVPEVMKVVLSATQLHGDRVAVLARLLVSPSARRLGIGRALLEHAAGAASRLGLRAVLDVVDQHRDAIALYERAGWTRVGQVDWKLPDGRPLREFVYVSP